MKVNPGRKTCCMQKKEWWILVTYHALLKYTSFLGVDIRKKSIKCISTFSIWQIHKDHYQKILSGHRIDEKFPYARFRSTSKQFFTRTVFYFFGFNIVCQLLARHLSIEITTMNYYSGRLKPFFAQIRPSCTCTYLALVFSVNKW